MRFANFIIRIIFPLVCAAILTRHAFAQSILPGNGGAQHNVTLVYNAVTGQPDSIVIDAANLNDPSFTCQGCVQYSIPTAIYNDLNGPQDLQDYTATLVSAQAVQ